MAMNPYPNSRNTHSIQEGAEFLDLVMEQLRTMGFYLQPYTSAKNQLEKGESIQGWEVKLDNRFLETGRLSIEIAEKTRADNENWIPSGIYRKDNSYLYIQGNPKDFYVFQLSLLRWLHKRKIYEEAESFGTVKKFYLPIDDANHWCLLHWYKPK